MRFEGIISIFIGKNVVSLEVPQTLKSHYNSFEAAPIPRKAATSKDLGMGAFLGKVF